MVRMIGFRFMFSRREFVPVGLRNLERAYVPAKNKTCRPRSSAAIESTENCSLEGVELTLDGYEMVDAYYEERTDSTLHNRPVHVVQFWFGRTEYAAVSREFGAVRHLLIGDFDEICTAAFWRVVGFVNPFTIGGKEVPGQHALSLNMEARHSRFQSDGSLVLQWRKDAAGKRLGESAVPIWPDYVLKIVGNEVSLIPTED